MNIKFKYGLIAAGLAVSFAACDKEEVYDSPVTREINMTLDGEKWDIYYGTDENNHPLFIYNADGKYFANYGTSYHITLPAGGYKIICTNQAKLMTPPISLGEQIIEQDPETKQTFGISDPVDYTPGTPMVLPMKTRTGMLRLRATDSKADRTYSTIRAVFTTPVTAYSVGEAKPIVGEPLELTRDKATTGGGVGYTDDAILIETGSVDRKVGIRIDYLDDDMNLVRSKSFADDFAVLANDTVEVSFALNNADEPVIINYNIALASEGWQPQTVYPSVKVDVPDGYTYVTPDDDFNAIFTQLKNDPSVDQIKIFLKANGSYTLPDASVKGLNKGVSLVAQKPGYGQRQATLSVKNISLSGNLKPIHFENLSIAQAGRMFNLARTDEFTLDALEFVNCRFDNWTGQIWKQATNTTRTQRINSVVMDECVVANYSPAGPMFDAATTATSSMPSWTFSNTVFHGRNYSTRTVVLNGLNKMTDALDITVDGCTFLDTRGTAFTYFNIDAAAAQSSTLTVTGNRLGGVQAAATWFNLGKVDNVTASGNTHCAGYNITWGVTEPAETTQTFEELLNSLNL